MFCVCDVNQFTLTRGDTFEFPININIGSKLCPQWYQPNTKDSIYGAIIEPNQSWENAIIRKVIKPTRDNKLIFKLESSDTEYLLTGKYFFTLKLVTNTNNVTTILPMKEFWITGTDKDVCCSDSCNCINN